MGENNSSALLVGLAQEIASQAASTQDSVSWAVVQGDSRYTKHERPSKEEVEAAEALQSARNTAWQLNQTLNELLVVTDIEFTFQDYPNTANRAYGFSLSQDESTWAFVNPENFSAVGATMVTQISAPGGASLTPPVETPTSWIDYGPIWFLGGNNIDSEELLEWLRKNAHLVSIGGETPVNIIASSYKSTEIEEDTVRYSVRLLSDETSIITGLLNQSSYTLHRGDYVFLYKIGGKLTNSYIFNKSGSSQNSGFTRSSQTTKNEITSETDIFSGTFKQYESTHDASSSWLAIAKLGDFFVATASLKVAGTSDSIDVKVWWRGGQLFDAAGKYRLINSIRENGIAGLEASYGRSDVIAQGHLDSIWSGLNRLLGDEQFTDWKYSLPSLMPAAGDELLLVQQDIPENQQNWAGECPFKVVGVIKK